MPLLWKKTKTKPNRISRIVADLQPTSRVVETGFPTSLVDLFVKNRDRIKKHSLNLNLNNTKHSYSAQSLQSVAPPPTPDLTPHNSPCLPRLDDHHPLQPDSTPPDLEFHLQPNANSTLFVVAAKMFLAVIPALTTKKLAIGFTLFAFLLFLLHILGKFAVRFFQRRRDQEEDPPTINSAFHSEIQIVELNSDNDQLGLDEGLLPNREKGLGCCSDLGEFPIEKRQRSRSAKLRAKIIKKLIPKKLRSGTRLIKRNKNEKNEIMIMENQQSSCEEEEEEEIWEMQQNWEHEGSSSSSEEDESKKNLECKIMILMILLGLCGGRFLGLVLTLSGCFIFKFIQFLKSEME